MPSSATIFSHPSDPVLADSEVLLGGIPVMELVHRRRNITLTSEATATHVGYGPHLPLAAQLDYWVARRFRFYQSVPKPMAVRVKKIALLGLGAQPLSESGEIPDAELL